MGCDPEIESKPGNSYSNSWRLLKWLELKNNPADRTTFALLDTSVLLHLIASLHELYFHGAVNPDKPVVIDILTIHYYMD